MIQKKMADYKPNYPRKIITGIALTAATLAAITGCQPSINGMIDVHPPVEETTEPGEVTEMGYIGIEPTEVPEEELVLDGEVAIDEPAEDDLALSGAVAIPPDNP